MAEPAPAPRVNKALMASYVNRTVALVGSMESWTGNSAIVKASDGGLVTVIPAPGADYSSKFVEVIGLVQPDGSLQEFKCTSFGDNFDLGNYDKLVALMHGKFAPMFI
ncbi:hypothetical protein SDRG_14437 [Saprolegnia diclina VS20]|uniref:Replication factor A protein 3 n=1 Tax=Saprolegnia diclina (strain VS20) TaxID=1156394 RepID=T0RE14_SAPDV|nr:hypothetical protein SDRG_14437 [Saprolegnia diclina VS20]EQC27857.1 hypothetical protein SDRG_14437 [Saprolegnia diclina VS20]|eukprot:XP_008618787.1 hypothetical protein SDRG_14437 [Saprolegnia diclina VS20]